MPKHHDHCLSVRELARRWRCRPARVRALVKAGTLQAIDLGGGGLRILPESVTEAERGPLAVRPMKPRKRRETIPAEVQALLSDV